MHGGTLRTFVNFAAENRPFQLIAGAASIIGLVITFNPGLPGAVWAAITSVGR